MNIPGNLKYTRDHEWILAEGDTATIGITDFAQKQLGDIVFVELRRAGEVFEQDETFGTVESVKSVSELFMPVAGEIIQLNDELNDSPELANTDPYTDGWLIKIKLKDAKSVNSLLSAAEYEKLIAEE